MTAMNGVGYALGLKQEMTGTGVWSFIKLSRKKDGEDDKGGGTGAKCVDCAGKARPPSSKGRLEYRDKK